MLDSARTGFSTLADLPIAAAFDVVSESQFDFVEVQMNHWSAEWMETNADRLAQLSRGRDADIVVHLPFGADLESVATADDTVREQSISTFEDCIAVASQAGATKGVLHLETTENAPHLASVGETDTLTAVVRSLDQYARDWEFDLCIENLPERYPDLDALETLVAETDVSLTIDTGHAIVNAYTESELAAFVDEHADRISHFHLNDTRVPEDEHLPFGAGTVDFERILGALPADWAGTLTTEVDTYDYDYIAFGGAKLDDLLSETSDSVTTHTR